MKYKINQRVLINIPVKFTGAMSGEEMLVESNGYQFWVHKSVVKNNNQVYGLGTIKQVYNGFYKVQIFDFEEPFDCKEEYLSANF